MDILAAAKFIANEEGFVPYVYDDGDGRWPHQRWAPGMPVFGTLTIGFGETDSTIIEHYVGREMPRAEGEVIFSGRLQSFWDAIRPSMTWEPGDNQGTALLSLAYNIGVWGFRTSSVLRHFNSGALPAAAEAFLLWKRGNTADDLLGRRKREMALFLTPDEPKAVAKHQRIVMVLVKNFNHVWFLITGDLLAYCTDGDASRLEAVGVPVISEPMSEEFLTAFGQKSTNENEAKRS